MSFSDFYGETTDENSHDILTEALNLGVDHIDTSDIYGAGRSEDVIGSFLKQQGSRANDFFKIASKGGITRGNPDRPFNNSREHLTEALDASLKRMRVDCIDLYYIHRREPEVPVEETVDVLKGFIAAGKIKSFGFSEIAPTTIRAIAALHPVAAIQSEYSLSTRGPELGVVRATKDVGAAMVAFSPVGRGLLTDRPHDESTIANLPFLKENPRFIEPNLSRNVTATEAFRAMAIDMGVATSSLSIAWLMHQDNHILPIPGTRSIKHFRELVAGAELTLSETDLKAINQILPEGWAHGDRYSIAQWNGIERYC